jgi:hypothetical protein
MRARTRESRNGENYLAASTVTAIDQERTKVETELEHVICGRYLGTRNGRPDVCWKSRHHAGTHL